MALKNGKGLNKKPSSYYDTLEVAKHASIPVINAAYQALMTDMYYGASGRDKAHSKSIIEAHEVLSNVDKKAVYDQKEKAPEGTVIGNYRIIEEIAEGGFGTTYRGEHILAGEPVCIKHCHRISSEYEQVLINEAKAIWDLRHYSLPVMRDFIRLEDDSLALVMSYIPGPTFEQIVSKNGKTDPIHVAWIAERLLNVLMYLHFNGVVHGDVKPQNIIVQPNSHQIVLVDFGLSMVKPTRTSDSKGHTPLFCAPEQLQALPLVPESDFYSLGMTMLYALSGDADVAARLEVPENVPDPLCKFIKRLLVRSVNNRPHWKDEKLCETIKKVRQESFGCASSNMKPIPGF